ncbi:helix-turn-helix domain-containing protein [Mangrovactinospora gilvigrisea]|nr:helix-turn-helix domain-containing protein [Mangrovactinospora gilvigrisea]
MWPELPSLVREIRDAIRDEIPDYRILFDGPTRDVIEDGVEQNLTTFVERVDDPASLSPVRDEMCRRLGRYEAYEGNSMDNLRAAYRLGARVALRRAKRVGAQFNLKQEFTVSFADTLFRYVDEMERLSLEGYREAEATGPQEPGRRQRRLLRLILAGDKAPQQAVTELAADIRFTVPAEVTLVAVAVPNAAEAPQSAPELGEGALVNITGDEPHMLLSGAPTDAQLTALEEWAAATGARAAVGVPVVIASAADSMRWARRTLELAEAGTIEPAPLLLTSRHLTEIWLMNDPALLEQLVRRQLGPLEAVSEQKRGTFVETLRRRIVDQEAATEIAEQLGVHAQTVRYRLHKLDELLGDLIHDPNERFATEIALRGLELRQKSGDGDHMENP